MRAWRLGLTASAALAAAAAQSAELTELPPPSGAGIERGVAILRCAVPSTRDFHTSRGTVLDVGADFSADVLLTTAHGLPAAAADVQRDCRVLVRGKEHPVVAVWRAGEAAHGPEHDWAVILTTRIGADLHRWRAVRGTAEWLPAAVASGAPVRIGLRYAGTERSDCRLEARTPDPTLLLAHSCITYPGTSGSPLLLGVDREAVLIGIHVGTQLMWDGKTFDQVSVARPLDAAVAAAIDAAVAQAAAAGTRSGERRGRRSR